MTTPDTPAPELLLKDLTRYLAELEWNPTKENLFVTGDRLACKLDLSGQTIDPAFVSRSLQEDPGLLDLVIRFFVRLHLDAFRKAALSIAGTDLYRYRTQNVTLEDSILCLYVSPGTVCLLNGESSVYPEEAEASPEVQETSLERMKAKVKEMPFLSRMQMMKALDERLGGVHRETAREVSGFAYRHLLRIRARILNEVPLSKLPPKENLWLAGPHGSGKTYMLNVLFHDILKLPFLVLDASMLRQAFRAGSLMDMVAERLITQSGDDPELAAIGVVCLDHLDQLELPGPDYPDSENAHIQQGLLHLLEGIKFPLGPDSPWGVFSTDYVPFIGVHTSSETPRDPGRRKTVVLSGGQVFLEMKEYPDLEMMGIVPRVKDMPAFEDPDPWNQMLSPRLFVQPFISRFSLFSPIRAVGSVQVGDAILKERILDPILAAEQGMMGENERLQSFTVRRSLDYGQKNGLWAVLQQGYSNIGFCEPDQADEEDPPPRRYGRGRARRRVLPKDSQPPPKGTAEDND